MDGVEQPGCGLYSLDCSAIIRPYNQNPPSGQYIPLSRFDGLQLSNFFTANPALTGRFLSSVLSGGSQDTPNIKNTSPKLPDSLDRNTLINGWRGKIGDYRNLSDSQIMSSIITAIEGRGVYIGFVNIAGSTGGGADLVMVAKKGGGYFAVSNTGASLEGKSLEDTLDALGYAEGRYTAFFRLIGKDGNVNGFLRTKLTRIVHEQLFGSHEEIDFWEQIGNHTPPNISMDIQRNGYSMKFTGKNTGNMMLGGSLSEATLPDGATLRSNRISIGYFYQGNLHSFRGSVGISQLDTPTGKIYGVQFHGNRNTEIGEVPGCNMLHWGGGVDMELQLSSGRRLDTGNIHYTTNLICQRSQYILGVQGGGVWSPGILDQRYALFQKDLSLILGHQNQNGNTSLILGGQHYMTLSHIYGTRDTLLKIQLAYKKALAGLTRPGIEGSLTYSHRF